MLVLVLGPTGATEVGPVVVSRGLFVAVVKVLSTEESGVVGLDVLWEGMAEVKLSRSEDDVLYVMLGW